MRVPAKKKVITKRELTFERSFWLEVVRPSFLSVFLRFLCSMNSLSTGDCWKESICSCREAGRGRGDGGRTGSEQHRVKVFMQKKNCKGHVKGVRVKDGGA